MEAAHFSQGVREALRANLAARSALLAGGTAPVGWKVAGGMPGVASDEGVDGLVFGYLTARSRVPDGGRVALARTPGLAADVELAIEVRLMRGEPVAHRVGVALEIVDVSERDMDEALTANAYHRCVAFGPLISTADGGRLEVSLAVPPDGPVTRRPEVAPEGTVQAMQRMLRAFGEQLHDGDLLIAGSLVQRELTQDGRVVASIKELGQVSLELELR
jgi:hypothetical protein